MQIYPKAPANPGEVAQLLAQQKNRELIQKIIIQLFVKNVVVTKWEHQFLCTLLTWRGQFTTKQLTYIRKIRDTYKLKIDELPTNNI